MALVRTDISSQASTSSFGTGTWTTASFTPPNNCVLEVIIAGLTNGGSSDISSTIQLSDSLGKTWTSIANIGDPRPYSKQMCAFYTQITTGASMTLSISTSGATDMLFWGVHIIAHTGHNTSSPIGATATKYPTASTGTESYNLSAAPASTSEVISALYIDNQSGAADCDPGTGWTLIYSNLGSSTRFESEYRNGSTSQAVSWGMVPGGGSANACSLAYEVQVAGAGGGGSASGMLSLLGAGAG